MSRPLRVLVIEDSEDDALLMASELERGGHEPVVERVDAPEAMAAALDGRTWDIVLADYSLPRFNALGALELLHGRGLDLPFIIVSGTIGEETAAAAMKAGAHDYLMKNNLARLAPAVERELREAEGREARRRAEQEIRRRNRELVVLNAIALVLSQSLDLNQLLLRSLEKTLELVGIESGSIWLLDKATGELSLALHRGLPMAFLEEGKKTLESLFERGPRHGEPLTESLNQEQLTSERPVAAGGLVPVAAVPLMARGNSLGMLMVSGFPAGERIPDELSLLLGIGSLIGAATENARLFEQVRAGRNRLQTLSRRLVEAQENERRHIARELHDEIGQLLTGLKLSLEMSQRLPAEGAGTGLSEAEKLVHELIGRVRELSLDLRPAMLDDLGLLPALLWHFERYQAQSKIHVTFEHGNLRRRFDPDIETAAYRIIQESLTNVARHAGVSEATVRIWSDEHTLIVQIEDTGMGFDSQAALTAGASSGLAGMSERVEALGGRLTMESTPGAGTNLTAELPLGGRLERRQSSR